MIGTSLGPYEITAKLGEGGMGEVWKAKDFHLGRNVALKVLPAGFTQDPERLARFEREAKLLAQLNHPNIAQIYGFEASGETRALVMELVEGPTLAERLEQGPFPFNESLSVSLQIAHALEEAHEKGIVHRDLKPQNIKASMEGKVKVLDFGLAKAMDPTGTASGAGSASQLAMSPTLTLGATQMGTILGTAAYMSPEQARGFPVDKRADIWAFGVVLYEMLVGRPLFAADTVTDTLAGVLKTEIDFSRLPASTPATVRRLLARCLERDPKRRLRDIGEARLLLETAAEAAPGTTRREDEPPPAASSPGVSRRRGERWMAISFATAVVAAIVGLLLERTDRGRTEARPSAGDAVRLAFVPPDDVTSDEGTYDATIVSPDGQSLVFTGRRAGENRRLWLRPLQGMEARPLADTDDAIEPFWSPDSRSVGFGAGGKLKRIDLAGGSAQTLADAPRLNGGAWSGDGTILYSPDFNSGLYRVPAEGGERALVARPDPKRGEVACNLPGFLPEGRRFYYRIAATNVGPSRYVVGSLESNERSPLLENVDTMVFAPPGWLLYVRNEVLNAQAVDPKTLEPRGVPFVVSTGLVGGRGFGTSRVSASDDGVLVVRQPREHDYRLVWFDRAGRRLGTVGPPARVANNGQSPNLSPDGRRVVFQRADPATRNQDIWTIDLERGVESRLTTDKEFDQLPVWSADSAAVYFSRRGLFRVATSRGGEERLIEGTFFAKDASPDGGYLVFGQRGEKTRADIYALPLAGERQPVPLLVEESSDYEPQVSPDGRWLAYNSDATGREEVYVRPLSADWRLGEATQLSIGGGVHPRWRGDGGELFYVAAPAGFLEARILAVAVTASGGRMRAEAPVELFRVAMFPNSTATEYDVTSDGRRFLVGTVEGASAASAVTLVLNWTAELDR